jgi:hypothetical protein
VVALMRQVVIMIALQAVVIAMVEAAAWVTFRRVNLKRKSVRNGGGDLYVKHPQVAGVLG